MDAQAKPQTITIDGVNYDFNKLDADIKESIALMEYARQQIQAVQMDLAMKTAAHTSVATKLRAQLDRVKPVLVNTDIQEAKTGRPVVPPRKVAGKRAPGRRK